MISVSLSISVLTHVVKDANAHDLNQLRKGIRGATLTIGRRAWRSDASVVLPVADSPCDRRL
jgi:hypothetical protein